MDVRALVAGLDELQAETLGDPEIRIAVLDGPVDTGHPCFAGARLDALDTLIASPDQPGPMSLHGTHVASLLFGQPGTSVVGVAPGCSGLVVPVFPDDGVSVLSQLDLARAVEQAVDAGAHVINISGGERTGDGRGDDLLERALARCEQRRVLVVAAVGNDGCDCLQVPAAHDTVLAVGALGLDGEPLPSNNWGEAFRTNGILAPGEKVHGAAPGGGTVELTGTSHATPIVAGVAALLLSLQHRAGGSLDPTAVRRALLDSATRCVDGGGTDCRRHLAGTLDGSVARARVAPIAPVIPVTNGGITPMSVQEQVSPPDVPVEANQQPQPVPEPAPAPAPELVGVGASTVPEPSAPPPPPAPAGAPVAVSPGVTAAGSSGECGCGGGGSHGGHGNGNGQPNYVYAIGTIGFDFLTEARRDSFRAEMAPDYPYDPRKLAAYLAEKPWESGRLTWLLELDQTPVYALEAEMPVGMAWGGEMQAEKSRKLSGDMLPPVSYVYKVFREALVGQAQPLTEADFVSRVSIPGVLTGRTTRLFSGQVVPVVEVQARGLHTWNEAALTSAAVGAVQQDREARGLPLVDTEMLDLSIRSFLDKIYYQFRNLGQAPEDRALNYAGTNAFMAGDMFGIAQGLMSGKFVPGENSGLFALDTVTVTPSPYCRPGSACFDVRVVFFDPENERRARRAVLFTVDVNDAHPVAIGTPHQFLL